MKSEQHVKRSRQAPIRESEVTRLAASITQMALSFDHEPLEHNYASAVLVVSDAILSVRRNYEKVVKPIVRRIQDHNLHGKSLQELAEIIETNGPQYLITIWRYKDVDRVKLLQKVCRKFTALRMELNASDDMETLQLWARSVTPAQSKTFGVKGVGIATFQYLRILSGVETVKPDVHLHAAIKDALGVRRSDLDVIELFEATASQLQVSARKLDYAIWNYYSKQTEQARKCT
jgi:hypothetical protein